MNDFILSLMMLGAVSSADPLPFWATANQWGLMPEHNGTLVMARASTQYNPEHTWQWRWGASIGANLDGGNPGAATPRKTSVNPLIDELYVSLKWKVFSVDLGMKHDPLDFYGASPALGSLSSTGGHIVASGNARTMPGYTLHLDPVPIPLTKRHAWIYGSFGDYKTLDSRYMQGTLVHRTKAYLLVNITRQLDFRLGLDHYALWAGSNANVPAMPASFANYFRVITGHSAGSSGTMSDQLNVIGDQGGGEVWRFDYRGDGWHATAQHDIPYNDGSGMGFQNFPDGVNTLAFSWDNKDRWVSDIVYEFAYTMWQSGTFHDRPTTEEERQHRDPADQYHYWHAIYGGLDNYFNNSDYRSGWTHFGRMIGCPFISPKGTHAGTWTSHGITLGIENNRVKVHHIGIGGKLWRVAPYRLMLSWSRNYGTYSAPYTGKSQIGEPWGTVHETPLHQVSAAFTGEVPLRRGLDLTWGLFADRGQLLPDNYGLTLGVRYTLR